MVTTPGIERIGQIAIPVADLERAVTFSADVLGLRLLFRAPPGQAFFDCGGVRGAHERGPPAVALTARALVRTQGVRVPATDNWLVWALLSAVFAAATAILAKIGLDGIGEASRVAPIDKLSVVLVALFAVAVLGERPSVRDWVGIGCVGAGVLLLSLRR